MGGFFGQGNWTQIGGSRHGYVGSHNLRFIIQVTGVKIQYLI